MRSKVRKLASLGSYMPNAFFLHVDTKRKLNQWRDWEPQLQCTYFHEYIHFLQDLSTLNGLYNIYCIGEYIQDSIVNHIYPRSEGKIAVPISPEPAGNNVFNNLYINSIIIGSDPEESDDVLNQLQVTGKATVIPNPYVVAEKSIDVSMVSVPYKTGVFMLGESQITESMAYLGEWLAYGNYRESSPNYPYCVVEQIAAFYNSDLAENQPLLFALCDLSLSYSNPAKALIAYFEEIEKNGCPKKDETRNYIQYLIRNARTQAVGIVGDSYIEHLLQYAQLTIQSLDNRFVGAEHYDLRSWYLRAICYLTNLRIANPTFMLDLVEGGPICENQWYLHLLNEVGTPLITNNAGGVYQEWNGKNVIGEKRMAIYVAAMSIYEALNDLSFECELKDYCKSLGYCVNEACKKEPWKKARPLFPCPYGRLWYAWKLRKFTLGNDPKL